MGFAGGFHILHRFSTGFNSGNVENSVELVENTGEKHKIPRWVGVVEMWKMGKMTECPYYKYNFVITLFPTTDYK